MTKLACNTSLLVTGSGGVLGNAVLTHFRSKGFTRLFAPAREEMNLLDSASTQAYFSKHRPQAVVHLASVVFGLGGNLKHQMRSALENTAINNNLFAALQSYPTERLFFAGTVASYPFPYKAMPLAEESFFEGLPHYGEFGYAMAKRHAYTYLRILGEEASLRYTYGIFTNLYGPHDRFDTENGHVIPSLIAKAHAAAQSGMPLEIWGDGSAERDFLHAEDAARAILLCLDQDDENRLINISSGQGVTIRYLAQTAAAAAGVKQLHFDSSKPVGIPRRVVDNQKLTRLGFVPSISIEDGLARTYNWYAANSATIRR